MTDPVYECLDRTFCPVVLEKKFVLLLLLKHDKKGTNCKNSWFIVTLSHDGLKCRVLVYTRSSTCLYKQTVLSLNAFLKAKLFPPNVQTFLKGGGVKKVS